jgi:hypothetical protein
MTLLQSAQLMAAFIGAVSCAWWFITENQRERRTPFLLCCWCVLLVAFRLARYCIGTTMTGEQITLFNALANWLYLLGATSAAYIAIAEIVGARKHGNIH